MRTITLSGKIKFEEIDNFEHILLTEKDGFIIDLVSRVKELKLSFPDKKLQVNYWLSDDFCTKDQMIMSFLEKIYGKDIEAGYEDNGFMGSSWTGYCESNDTVLTFGGHSFYNELRDEEGRFIIIDFNVAD